MAMDHSKGMSIISGNSHKEFAKLVAQHLNVDLGKCFVHSHSNCETAVDLTETVRGRDVYIIQTGTKNVNNDIMELLIMIYAAKTSCARSVTIAMPYLPYSKQAKMRKRGSIVSQLVAKMLCKAGINQLITMDLHSKEIQGFFDVPVDNLRASPFLIRYIMENIQNYSNAVIVARNPASVMKASSYAERLRLNIAVIHGEDRTSENEDNDDGRNSPPPAATDGRKSVSFGMELLPTLTAKEKPPLNIVGNVQGHVAIIIEDMIDDVDQFLVAAELLHNNGADKVYVMATHGLLSSDAARKLEHSFIDEIVVTNTVPHELQKMQCRKIKTVDVSILIAEAIRRIHNNESMSYLFMNIPKDD